MNEPDSNAGPGPGNDPEFPAPPEHLAGLAGMDLVRRALEEARAAARGQGKEVGQGRRKP